MDDAVGPVLLGQLEFKAARVFGAHRAREAGLLGADDVPLQIVAHEAALLWAHPGVLQGHFGLEGVRERVRKLGGSFRIESSPGAGAAAFVELPLAGAAKETGETKA